MQGIRFFMQNQPIEVMIIVLSLVSWAMEAVQVSTYFVAQYGVWASVLVLLVVMRVM